MEWENMAGKCLLCEGEEVELANHVEKYHISKALPEIIQELMLRTTDLENQVKQLQ